MAATIVVFENDNERSMMCADLYHDFTNQKNIFGTENKKFLDACNELFLAALQNEKSESEQLLKKIYGIAKAHGLYVTWYGKGSISCEPDRFLVSGRGYDRLAFIQC